MRAMFRVKLSSSCLNLVGFLFCLKNAFGIIAREIKSSVTVPYFMLILVKEVHWNITMELLSQYVSSSSQSESSDTKLQPAKVRSMYLITYSQADLSIFPDRQSFADGVCEAVLNCEGPKSKVIQWTCSQENHKKQGKHYRMVIKLAADMAIFKEQLECLCSLF